MKPGIYKELSNKDYHSSFGISRSGIMKFKESAFIYYHQYKAEVRTNKKPSATMILGSAFHTLILEPHLFESEYAVEPTKVLLKDVGKDSYERYKAMCEVIAKSGKIVLSEEEWVKMNEMKKSLMQHKEAWSLLNLNFQRNVEDSFYWEDKESGLLVKSRPDLYYPHLIIDLKTIDDASTKSFQRSMVSGGYHIQGAMVQDAIKEVRNIEIEDVVNICVETNAPYPVAIKIISKDALEFGRKEYKAILQQINWCEETKTWPSYESEIVDLPGWY